VLVSGRTIGTPLPLFAVQSIFMRLARTRLTVVEGEPHDNELGTDVPAGTGNTIHSCHSMPLLPKPLKMHLARTASSANEDAQAAGKHEQFT
jgi:hypothetical protein